MLNDFAVEFKFTNQTIMNKTSFVDLQVSLDDLNNAEVVTKPLMECVFDASNDNSIFNEDVFSESKSVCNCSYSIHQTFPITLEHLENLQSVYKKQTSNDKKARLFYRKQDELIETFKDVNQFTDSFEYEESIDPKVLLAAKLSFFCNLILFAAKIVAAVLSGSLSILSSVVDSAVDLISGVIVWYTNRAIRLTNIYNYPLGSYLWKYTDPIGAILLSIYIFINWWQEGTKQIRSLVGHTAPSWFLQVITWICLQHSPHIVAIETVKAVSIGINYLVEVHIVLPRHMALEEAHDIGESLQLKIENVDRVERAFVHLDYECIHDPSDEHKPLHVTKPRGEENCSMQNQSEC